MVVGLPLFACFTLLRAVPAFAQEVPGGEAVAVFFWAMLFVVFIPFYIYWAWATQTIAKKTNTENGWLAWIPIANLILWANIARKPIWWGILCIIPIVNIVFMILLWMAIAEARKKPSWWGIMLIVPMANLIVPGYLAWSD
jgi:hypothetical protein